MIESRFEIHLSVWTVGRYLKIWGFTPQRPIRKAFEQNPEAVRQWLQEEYPNIHQQAKEEKATIFWGDETGLRSDHAVGRTYGIKGQTPVIPITGQRFGCSMMSAITNRGQLQFMVFKHKFNADVFKDFLSRLVRQSEGKIYLIVDRHPVHRSAQVKNWLNVHREKIHMYFLPGYSPELNPDELLNQDIKSNALGRKRISGGWSLFSDCLFLRESLTRGRLVNKYRAALYSLPEKYNVNPRDFRHGEGKILHIMITALHMHFCILLF